MEETIKKLITDIANSEEARYNPEMVSALAELVGVFYDRG